VFNLNFGCGGPTASVFGISWKSWTTTEAVGEGTWARDTCEPDCASAAAIRDEAVLVLLSRPRIEHDELLFTLVTVQPTASGAAPFSECVPVLCPESTVTTTTLGAPPFAFVDPETLAADLSSAWLACVGMSVVYPASEQQFFDNQCSASEVHQTYLAEHGQPYFVPDPTADALAFAQAYEGGLPCDQG